MLQQLGSRSAGATRGSSSSSSSTAAHPGSNAPRSAAARAVRQQQPDWYTRAASFGLATATAVAALWCQPAAAAPLWPRQQLVVLGDTNTAVLGELKRLQQTKQRYGTKDVGAALTDRFLAVQDQLQRIQRLVQIRQYDDARMQLREGAFANLRGDLRYEAEYRGVQPEAVRSVVQGLEQLDGQLKRRETFEAIKPGLQQLQQELQLIVQEGQQ